MSFHISELNIIIPIKACENFLEVYFSKLSNFLYKFPLKSILQMHNAITGFPKAFSSDAEIFCTVLLS